MISQTCDRMFGFFGGASLYVKAVSIIVNMFCGHDRPTSIGGFAF